MCWNIHYTAGEREKRDRQKLSSVSRTADGRKKENLRDRDRQNRLSITRILGGIIRQKHNCWAGTYIIQQERNRQTEREGERQRQTEKLKYF